MFSSLERNVSFRSHVSTKFLSDSPIWCDSSPSLFKIGQNNFVGSIPSGICDLTKEAGVLGTMWSDCTFDCECCTGCYSPDGLIVSLTNVTNVTNVTEDVWYFSMQQLVWENSFFGDGFYIFFLIVAPMHASLVCIQIIVERIHY